MAAPWLAIRNLAETTIDAYTYHVRGFADFTGKPLEQTTVEDVRTFQLHLIRERKLAYSSFNQAVCALRFYFTHTQPRPWPVTMVPFGKRPKKLPTVLIGQEIEQLIACTTNLKHRTFIMTLYACGLRYSRWRSECIAKRQRPDFTRGHRSRSQVYDCAEVFSWWQRFVGPRQRDAQAKLARSILAGE